MFKFNLAVVSFVAFVAASALAQAPADSAKPAGPNDAQIAHIVVTANAIDIEAGKLAKSKSKNSDVKTFAKLMVDDHTGVNKKAVALAKKLKVTPEDNDTSKALKKGASENVASLKKLKGPAFDKAYIDHEVDYHQQVLDAIKNVLIPNAKNAELADLLKVTQPAIEAHLQHAKDVQAKFAK